MQMPSLLKYFAFVGGTLFALLSFVSYVLDPSTGASTVATQPKRTLTVQHDPGASKIERWRDEQRALKAAEQEKEAREAKQPEPAPSSQAGMVAPAVSQQAKAQPVQPARPEPKAQEPSPQARPVAAQATATAAQNTTPPATLASADASLSAAAAQQPTAPAADHTEALKAEKKAKADAEKARKRRIARERERERERYRPREQMEASNRQDDYYYGQRRQAYVYTQPSYAYAPPPPAFGPFGGGWGRGW